MAFGFIKKALGLVSKLAPGPIGTAISVVSSVIPGGNRASAPPISQVPGRLPEGRPVGGRGGGGCPPGFPGCQPLVGTPGGGGCPRGTVPDPTRPGVCVDPQSPLGRDVFGEAQMGLFGAGLVPEDVANVWRRCPPATVLGRDGLCYNKSSLNNKDRLYPRGTRPLLTGGEMKCIRVAARAAGKLETKTKQLRRMGMLKALPRRSSAPRGRARAALPAGTSIVNVE